VKPAVRGQGVKEIEKPSTALIDRKPKREEKREKVLLDVRGEGAYMPY